MSPPTTFSLSEQDIRNLTSIDGIDNRWNTYGLSCTHPSKEPYVVSCTKRVDQLEEPFQKCTDVAGSGLLILSILLETIMVTTIFSLGYYVYHRRKKLKEKENSDGFNAEGNNTPTMDVATNLLLGDRVNDS